MTRRILPLLAVLLLALAACGSPASHKSSLPGHGASLAPPCDPPAGTGRMGLCVQQHFGFRPGENEALGHTNGLDISLYQELPAWGVAHANGIRFVWNQAFDGFSPTDWNFFINFARELAHGIIPGGYVFLRPGCGYCQGERLGKMLRLAHWHVGDLPPLVDTEVTGAYEQDANAVAGIEHQLGHVLVMTYTSPGLWAGCCRDDTGLDAAIWGQPGYTFGGWPTYLAQQDCGTCRFPAVPGPADLQVDHGMLRLLHPPTPPSPAHIRAEIKAHHALLVHLRQQLAHLRHKINRYGCARRKHDHEHLGPRCKGWYAAGARISHHGRQEDAIIARFEHELR